MTPKDVIAEAEREELLTVLQFSKLFGRDMGSLYRALKRGRYPDALKIAGKWYIKIPKDFLYAARASEIVQKRK